MSEKLHPLNGRPYLLEFQKYPITSYAYGKVRGEKYLGKLNPGESATFTACGAFSYYIGCTFIKSFHIHSREGLTITSVKIRQYSCFNTNVVVDNPNHEAVVVVPDILETLWQSGVDDQVLEFAHYFIRAVFDITVCNNTTEAIQCTLFSTGMEMMHKSYEKFLVEYRKSRSVLAESRWEDWIDAYHKNRGFVHL